MALKLTILTPERKLLEGEPIEEVTLPGTEGQVQLLPGHASMVGALEMGPFHYQSVKSGLVSGFVSAGFFEVSGDWVTVTAEVLELKGEIDVNRAKRAQQLAEEMLRDANIDEHKFREYQLALQRSLIRQQVAGREYHAE